MIAMTNRPTGGHTQIHTTGTLAPVSASKGVIVRAWPQVLRVCLCVLAIGVALLSPAVSGGAQGGKGSAIALPDGWTRVEAQGTITTLSPRTDTFGFLSPLKDIGSHSVKIISGSVIQIKSNLAAVYADLRVGDQIKLWGIAQPDGTVLAAHVLLLSRKGQSLSAASALPLPAKTGMHGLVLAVGEDMLTLLTDAGQLKEVVRAPTVRVQSGDSSPTVQEFDIVRVEGDALSDGNISATRIVVEFAGTKARRIFGRVTSVVPEASLFVIDDAAFVNVVPETFMLQGTALRSVQDLSVGRRVLVIGAIGATPFIVRARVVSISP